MRYEHKNNQLQETEQLASMYTENSSSDILIIAVFWKKRKKKKKKKKVGTSQYLPKMREENQHKCVNKPVLVNYFN